MTSSPLESSSRMAPSDALVWVGEEVLPVLRADTAALYLLDRPSPMRRALRLRKDAAAPDRRGRGAEREVRS